MLDSSPLLREAMIDKLIINSKIRKLVLTCGQGHSLAYNTGQIANVQIKLSLSCFIMTGIVADLSVAIAVNYCRHNRSFLLLFHLQRLLALFPLLPLTLLRAV